MSDWLSAIGVDRTTRVLFGKEWRQLLRSRVVVITSAILPTFLMLALPLLMMAASAEGEADEQLKRSFGMFAEIGRDPRRLPVVLLPLQVSLTALIMPLMMITHAIISEREQRTLELLIALPVRVEQVIKAKLLAVLSLCSAITVPLLAIDLIALSWLGLAGSAEWLGMPLLLLSVLAFSCAGSLLVGLLARDFRTANNLAGVVVTPALLLNLALVVLLPAGAARPLVGALVHLLGAGLLTALAMRRATFERLLQ